MNRYEIRILRMSQFSLNSSKDRVAKKQSRKAKKSGNDAPSGASKQASGSIGVGSTDAAGRSEVKKLDDQVDWQIYASLIFAACFVAYFFLFVMAKTADGSRFGLYFYLVDNLSIYTTFWTGSASGAIAVFDRWPIVLGLSIHLLIAFGIGNLCIRLLGIRMDIDRLEVAVLGIGLGLSLISTATFLMGCVQLYAFKQFCVVPVLIAGLAGLTLRKPNVFPADSIEMETMGFRSSIHWSWYLLGIVAIPFAIFILMGSMIPPWEYDVREYHLQVPKEWFQAGGVGYMSHNVYGNMPLGTEMHALFAMLYSFGERDWWWGAVIGKTVSGCFSILNAMILFSIGKRLSGAFAGVGAAMLYLTTPWTVQNSIIGYNESAVACYLLLSVFLMLLLCRRSDGKRGAAQSITPVQKSNGDWGLLMLLGLMIGSSVAVKYTAVVFVALPAIVLFIVLKHLLQKETLVIVGKQVFVICIGMLITCGPWLCKNAVLTGNPTYPLAESVFPSSRSEKQNEQWKRAHSISSKQINATQFQNSINSLLFGNSWLSPLLIPCLALGCLQIVRIRVLLLFLGFLIFAFSVWWLATHRLERFLLPAYPIACLLGGVGIGWSKHKVWLATITLIMLIGSSCNFLISTSRVVGDVRVLAPLKKLDVGSASATDYSDELVAPLSHLSPATVWLNENHVDAKVLFLGECRPFYSEFDVIYNTCFDECETWKRCVGRSSNEIHEVFQSEGIDFLLVNWAELNRLQSTYGYNVNADPDVFDYSRVIRQLETSVLRKVSDVELPTSIELFKVLR